MQSVLNAKRVARSLGVVLAALMAAAVTAQDQNYEAAYQKLIGEWQKAAAEDKTKFEKAVSEGDEAWTGIKIAQARLKIADKPDERKKIDADMKTAEADAMKFHVLALAKAPDETDANREQLIEIRDRVCYLTYQKGQFAEAAAIGEYLARKYPDNKFATHGAQVATASYLQLYNKVAADQKAVYMNRLVGITAYTSKQWPATPEGRDALSRLGQYALASGDRQQAERIFNELPKDSDARYDIQLRLAQAKWYEYLTAAAKPNANEDAQKKLLDETKASLTEATKWLRDKNAAAPTFPLLAGELTLVQIFNQVGDFENARKLLEIPKTGLLETVRLNLAVVQQGNLRGEAYKAALRTYLGQKNFDGAEKAINGLSSLGGADSDPAKATQMLGSLAKQLTDEVQAMRTKGAPADQLQAKLDALGPLLEKVASRKEGHTFGTLSWPAETLYDLATKLDEKGDEPSKASKDYYQRAVKIYDEILTRSKDEPSFATVANLTGIRMHMAECQRRLGDHKEAFRQLTGILEERPNHLVAQVQAAYTYQDLASLTKKPEIYDLAMKGGEPRKPKEGKGPEVNVVWGWGKLAVMTQQNPQFKTTIFHEARYNLAYCRFRQASMMADAKEKSAGLERAFADIRVTHTLNPEMGGPEWQTRYNGLLKVIQKALGKKEDGLAAFGTPAEAPKTAPAKS